MENYKYIDITQLPDDLWQDAKNLIALDSNGEVIKAEKQDSYSKDEIDDLLKDAEISADKLQNKIQINSASTDYVVTQPTVSGDSLVITDSMSDKNQYHTFGYDKTYSTTSYGLLNNSTPLYRGTNEYNCTQWDGNSIRFTYSAGYNIGVRLSIPYTYNGVKYVTHFDTTVSSSYKIEMRFGEINDQNFVDYQSVPFKQSEVYKAFGANGTFILKKNDVAHNYSNSESTYNVYIFPGDKIEMTIANFQLTASNGALIIENPRFYILSNNFIYGDVQTENYTYDYPERLSDYIRYANDVKAYILTDKNTKFKTINGEQITGDGNIEISTDVDLSNYVTKSELNTKQDTLVSGTNIKSINGTTLLGSGNMELATKEELNTKQNVISDLDSIRSGAAKGETALQSVPSGYATEQWVNEQGFLKEHQDISNLATKAELATKQDVINDLDSIRSGAALGSTALQSVPDTYALKSEIPDISTKQDKLVSGTNIKTINGTSILGSGNIVIEASADNVPTLQTTPKGKTNNYIYSTGIFDGYGVISDITNAITYSTDKASIATWKRYWGEESSNSHQSWSINGATTSKAGLMSASDKSKLDGIDLSTKQDKLVSGTNIKTINGTSLLGSGDITIEGGSGNVDLTDYYTKSETNALVSPKLSQVTLTQAEYDALQTKEENVLYVISDAEDIKFKTINGAQITGEGNIEVATKSELNAKQDVISDLDTIRSGAAKGATALQSVPSGYATEQWVNEQGFLKEHQDISNLATKSELNAKQDTLVSGTSIKTVNGTSLLGSGNIEIAKEWIGTQAQYDALSTKDNNTTYYITE